MIMIERKGKIKTFKRYIGITKKGEAGRVQELRSREE